MGKGRGGSGRGAGEGLDAVTACDVLWSFASIGHPAHSLCEAMARDLVDKVGEKIADAVGERIQRDAHACMHLPAKSASALEVLLL